MRKTTLLFLLFTLTFFSKLHSQYMDKTQLTNDVYSFVYGSSSDPDDYPAAHYPSVYLDLQEGTDFEKKAKLLLYLEFDNGYSALRRDLCSFRAHSIPYHTSVIKTIIEAYNVPLVTGGVSLPYSDVNESTLYYEHILTAYSIGMLDDTSELKPYEGILYDDAYFYLTFMSNSYSSEPTQTELEDEDNYFNPNNFTPENMGVFRGIEQGVFNHYAKNSFVIPDRKMNLNFSHFYSTTMVEIPEDFYAIKPLGRGWSHTYNSYIIRENNVGSDNVDYYYIVEPNGTIQVYDIDEEKYVTKGVYDELSENSSSTRIYIRKKNQVRYKYQKLDSDRELYYLTEIREPNGNEINIDYESAEEDDTKRIEEVESPSGKKLTFKYRDDTDLIERITDPINRRIYFDYSGVTGGWVYEYPVLVEFEDAESHRTVYNYGINNPSEVHLLKRIELPEGNKIEAEYDNNNNGKLREYTINDNDPIDVDVEFNYDSDDTVVAELDIPMPDGNNQKHTYIYNEDGVLTHYENDTDDITIQYPTSSTNPTPLLPTETNTNGLKIEYDYDNKGNIEEIDIEDGKSVKKYEYDSDNNVTEYTDPEGNVTKFSYDSDENLIEIEDAYNNSINYTYDNYGQIESITNQEGITINYTFENDGVISTITAPEGIESSFNYDGVNRLTSKTVNGLSSSYSYDDNDNLTSFINTGGFTTGYDYDKNNNLERIINSHGITTEFDYNNKDQVVSENFGGLITEYDYNDDGTLDRITKPSNTRLDFDYDDEGRLKETETISDIDYNNRNLIKDIENDAGRIDLRYDDLNRLERVTTVHGHRVEYDYEKTGLVEDIEYPTINGTEVEIHYSYDKKNRIWKVILEDNLGHDLVIAEYEYYDDDRIRRFDYGNTIGTRYSYDNAGRLNRIYSTTPTPDVVIIYENDIVLDSRGNILQESEAFQPIPAGHNGNGVPHTGTNTSYSYTDNNHAESIHGVSHNVDDDGNTIDIGNDISILYDEEDRLTSYTDDDKTSTFVYNAYNQRISATRDGEITKYIRDIRTDNVLISLDSNDNPIYYYLYTPNGQLIARMNPQGELFYYHSDIRGSTIAITNDNKEITHQYRYDDFGSITKSYELDDDYNPYRYVGTYGVEFEYNDLYYMRARYYTTTTGRFLTEDPIWHTNLYPYADNNPISRIDPNGELSFFAILTAVVFDFLFSPTPVGEGADDSVTLPYKIIGVIAPTPSGKVNAVRRGASKILSNSISRTHRSGSTVLGHSFQKHSQRNPQIWENLTGSPKTWHKQALKHYDEIMEVTGDFIEVNTPSGIRFLEKRLQDGRGIRLNLDGTFKSFID